jgi:ribosomal protein S15P/S13E
MANAQTIQLAIEQLVARSKNNRENIEHGKTTSNHLRDEIQIASIELERDAFSLNSQSSEKEHIALIRQTVSEDDCSFLKASIDTISKHVKEHQTDEALALTGKLEKNVTLLRKRLQYIAALEQLVNEYEQEKQIRAKLKAIAEVLDIDAGSEEQQTKLTPSEDNQEFTVPVVDTYPSDESTFNTTLH